MSAVHIANIGGELDGAMTSSATAMTSGALAAMGAIAAPDYAWVCVDPDGIAGAPEWFKITALTAGAATATVERAQQGSTARAHKSGVEWVHTLAPSEVDAVRAGDIIGMTVYNPGSAATPGVTSATLVDVDATNLAVDFIVPDSGEVLVVLEARATGDSSTTIAWGVREGSSVVGAMAVIVGGALSIRTSARFHITGLTPGDAKTYKFAHAREFGSGSPNTGYGGTLGAAIMKVEAA